MTAFSITLAIYLLLVVVPLIDLARKGRTLPARVSKRPRRDRRP